MMTNEEFVDLQKQGVLISNSVSAEKLSQLAHNFSPKKTEHDLVRLGPRFDGGYLVPNDLQDIAACFSPGVSNYAFFEQDLLSKYGINSHQADFSVGGPPHGFSPLSFTKKYIGAYDDDVYMTMESWVTRQWEYDLGRDLILQMDIEGAEYSSLLATPDRILKRFRIIVLEMHGLQDWAQSSFYEIASSLINKLSQSFIVVHNHPNNHGGMFNINGFEMPGTIEITLLRKDRCKVIEKTEVFPHHLDAPCGPQLPEVVLPDGFR